MNFLIVGVNGMAGHMIALYLSEKGHAVTGFARKENSFCGTIIGDALDRNSVKQAVLSQKFDVVVNCIGVLNKEVDKDPANGIYLNSVLPHELSEYCKMSGSKLIHLSSDCVFSGKKGKYVETDIPDEISYYGRTKYLGEVTNDHTLTFRTSIVGPEIKTAGVGLFNWFMHQTREINGYSNVIWSGVTTLELAKAIDAAAKQKATGLYHLSNNQVISKRDLLYLFNLYCRQNKVHIHSVDTPVSDKSLLCTRNDFKFVIPDYETMIIEMAKWIENHKALYVQYVGA